MITLKGQLPRIVNFSPVLFAMCTTASGDYAEFKKVLDGSKNIVVLTGAGISAESGIPTFRGGSEGLWRTRKYTELASRYAFEKNPGLVWEFYQYRRDLALKAQPNNGHKALAKYERICKKEGREFTVITQNVDGLHQKAGSQNVIELHGALRKIICTNPESRPECKTSFETSENLICKALKGRGDLTIPDEDLPKIKEEDLPKCKNCNSLLRPYIVWFGEDLDENVMTQFDNLMEKCDLCLVIGTSSIVYPAAMFAPRVAERKQPVAEFNINSEPAEGVFTFHFPGKCGTTLPEALGVTL